MYVGLQGDDELVDAEGEHTGAEPLQAAVLAHALPHQARAADLGQCGQDEQEYRARNGHADISPSRGGGCLPERLCELGQLRPVGRSRSVWR